MKSRQQQMLEMATALQTKFDKPASVDLSCWCFSDGSQKTHFRVWVQDVFHLNDILSFKDLEVVFNELMEKEL